MHCRTVCLWKTLHFPAVLPSHYLSHFAVCATKKDLKGTSVSERVKPNPTVHIEDTTSRQAPMCILFPQLSWAINIAKVLVGL